jgi:hypothetical protein
MAGGAVRGWTAAACAAMALALVGCALFEPEPEPVPAAVHPTPPQREATVPPAPPQPPPGPPRPARKPAPPSSAATAGAPPPVSAPVQEAARPPTPRSAADDLRQMRPEDVVALLGEPWQRAESAPAVIWRYVGRGCQLDLYFFLDLQSKVTRVLDFKFLPDGVPRDSCIDELVAERREREAASFGPSRPR